MIIRRVCASLSLASGLLLTWYFLAQLVMFLTATQTLFVYLPTQAFLDRLPSDAKLLRLERNHIVLSSTEHGFLTRIYKSGARLVLPYGLTNCLQLRPTIAQTGLTTLIYSYQDT